MYYKTLSVIVMKPLLNLLFGIALLASFENFAQSNNSEIYNVRKIRQRTYDQQLKEMSSWSDWTSPSFFDNRLKVEIFSNSLVLKIRDDQVSVNYVLRHIQKFQDYYMGEGRVDLLDGNGEKVVGNGSLQIFNNNVYSDLNKITNHEYHFLIKFYRDSGIPIVDFELFISK